MADFDDAAYRAYKRALLAVYDICHLCGHGGADSLDHIIPRRDGGTNHPTNLAPAHFKPCPMCHVRCNQRRGARVLPSAHRSREW